MPNIVCAATGRDPLQQHCSHGNLLTSQAFSDTACMTSSYSTCVDVIHMLPLELQLYPWAKFSNVTIIFQLHQRYKHSTPVKSAWGRNNIDSNFCGHRDQYVTQACFEDVLWSIASGWSPSSSQLPLPQVMKHARCSCKCMTDYRWSCVDAHMFSSAHRRCKGDALTSKGVH